MTICKFQHTKPNTSFQFENDHAQIVSASACKPMSEKKGGTRVIQILNDNELRNINFRHYSFKLVV